jgi:hypothetical protein
MNRETILAALAARLSAKRAPWPEIPKLTTGQVLTVVAEGPERVIAREYGIATVEMETEIRRAARTANDAARATAANLLLDQLVTETYSAEPTLGGTCLGMRYAEGDTIFPSDGTDLVAAVALFVIEYERAE